MVLVATDTCSCELGLSAASEKLPTSGVVTSLVMGTLMGCIGVCGVSSSVLKRLAGTCGRINCTTGREDYGICYNTTNFTA